MIENEKNERILALAQDVLRLSRNTLLVNLRFLDAALSRFTNVHAERGTLMTDGTHLIYEPKHILKCYQLEKEIPARDYLHLVLHCVFQHMYIGPSMNRTYWDLACDMAVEAVITELSLRSVQASRAGMQQKIFDTVTGSLHSLTAEKIYHQLSLLQPDEMEVARLRGSFYADNHEPWYMTAKEIESKFGIKLPAASKGSSNGSEDDENANDQANGDHEQNEDADNETVCRIRLSIEPIDSANEGEADENDQPSDGNGDEAVCHIQLSSDSNSGEDNKMSYRAQAAEDWKAIAYRMRIDIETFGKKRGFSARHLTQNLTAVTREKYDYTSFLKKFAVMGETMKINNDEFDYIYYTYGLQLYEKMPLVEPLEYKDVKRIKEFVIAIDTSGSVHGETVQHFVQKTYNILKSTESFFSKINLHIIQCDADIQKDIKITTQEEFDAYLAKMQLHGFGGTDFRPVFEYVEKLIEQKEFSNLKGLIYFTDGQGTFPEKKPPYETAFVFIDNDYNNYDVPPWAIKLILQKDDI